MPRAKLLFLNGPVYIPYWASILNRARRMADDDCNDGRIESFRGFQDMKIKSFSAQRMKHFGNRRLHSSSLTGGE